MGMYLSFLFSRLFTDASQKLYLAFIHISEFRLYMPNMPSLPPSQSHPAAKHT